MIRRKIIEAGCLIAGLGLVALVYVLPWIIKEKK